MATSPLRKTLRSIKRNINTLVGADPVDDSLRATHPDFEADALKIIERVQPFTMTSPERIYSLIQSVKYLTSANVPGAFVECGVWKGGSMMAMALTLQQLGVTSRDLYLFDTFEGMPPPKNCDKDFRGDDAKALLEADRDRAKSAIWAVAQIDEVRTNLAGTGYPVDRLHYVQGRVEDTLPSKAPEQIALLRLDTDWYESTRHELEQLFPRLMPGGVLIIDDYGYWQGARKAVDEFMAGLKVPLLLNRIDTSGRIALKR